MKKTIVPVMILPIAFGYLMAEEIEPFAQVKHLLTQVEQSAPEEDQEDVAYFILRSRWKDSPAFTLLQNTVSQDWENILENVKEIAPSEFHQGILFRSFNILPPKDAHQYLNKLATLSLDKAISNYMFEWCIGFYEIDTHHALARNYNDPAVVEILQKAKIISSNNEKAIWNYNQMLSGTINEKITEPHPNISFELLKKNIIPIATGIVFIGVVAAFIRKIRRGRSR